MPEFTPALDTPIGPIEAVPAKPAKAKKSATKKMAKKAAKKAPAKKAAKAKKAGSGEPRKDRGLSKLQAKIVKTLKKAPQGLTRAELSHKIGDIFIGDSALGHVDATKIKERSLLGRKFVSLNKGEPRELSDGTFSDSEGAKIWKLTAAGNKAAEAL